MATWNYIIGNEKDFEGAPDWANLLITGAEFKGRWFLESFEGGKQKHQRNDGGSVFSGLDYKKGAYKILAQRERVTSVNDDRLAHKLRPRSIRHSDGTVQFGCIQTAINTDNINHPLRYTKGDIECIDAIKAATVGKTGIEAVDVGHIIRYLWRYEEKDGLESVKKAEWYIKHLINELSESNK